MATKKAKKSVHKKSTSTQDAESKAAGSAAESVSAVPKESAALSARPAAEGSSEFMRLRNMNLWLALAFGVQAVAIVLFGGSKTLPILTSYLAPDQLSSEVNGHQVLGVAMRHIADVRLTVIAAGFLALFGLGCLALATLGRGQYEARLRRGSNVGRWLAFGLGAGGMVVALALESGVYALATLALMFVAMLLAGALEPLAEKYKATPTKTPVLGHALCAGSIVAGLLPWAVLALGVLGALLWGGKIPGSLYVMYGTTLVLFGCWALAAHFRITKRGKWTDTLYAEKMYMFLSLAAATVLAWQMFAGAI